MQNFILQNWSS